MQIISVEVREDHLEFLARARPMTAVAELVWNALDADASEVRVEFAANDLGGIEAIHIRDNGHGLAREEAALAFGSLGGSPKRPDGRTPRARRALHGRYGKGRFRAFALGNRVEWHSVYAQPGDGASRQRYSIVGNAAAPRSFALTDAEPADDPAGMTVEITHPAPGMAALRGARAVQEATDLFANYLRQYPGVRIVYDTVPLDSSHAEACVADCELPERITQDGARVQASLTVVEWRTPGRRGVYLCDDRGFALHALKRRPLFRGFSYTAYVRSAWFAELAHHGLLEMENLLPDLAALLDDALTAVRRHIARRETERAADLLEQWRARGLYPYQSDAATPEEAEERRLFDLYAASAGRLPDVAAATPRTRFLMLRLLQELVRTDPVRLPRVFDDVVSFGSRDARGETAEF